MTQSTTIKDKEIASAVAAALAKQTAETAIAVARTTAETATAVAKTASDAATEVAVTVSAVSADVKFIKDEVVNLTDAMKEGFKTVHDKQDITNGRITKNEGSITVLQVTSKSRLVYQNALWFAVTALTALVTYLIAGRK